MHAGLSWREGEKNNENNKKCSVLRSPCSGITDLQTIKVDIGPNPPLSIPLLLVTVTSQIRVGDNVNEHFGFWCMCVCVAILIFFVPLFLSKDVQVVLSWAFGVNRDPLHVSFYAHAQVISFSFFFSLYPPPPFSLYRRSACVSDRRHFCKDT